MYTFFREALNQFNEERYLLLFVVIHNPWLTCMISSWYEYLIFFTCFPIFHSPMKFTLTLFNSCAFFFSKRIFFFFLSDNFATQFSYFGNHSSLLRLHNIFHLWNWKTVKCDCLRFLKAFKVSSDRNETWRQMEL